MELLMELLMIIASVFSIAIFWIVLADLVVILNTPKLPKGQMNVDLDRLGK